ncbi:MAG: exopolysaccharide biosynthesis protein, partial [Cyclobacteriaceae bacterium]|nr:exopolysaccharide biosynthesis protein [Cyclobacteriaceae bacterium]
GVNLGGLGEDNGLFQMDNISALYSSRTMLKQAFLSSCTIDSTPQRLITRWAEKEKLIKKWRKKLNDPDFGFELPIDQFTIRHDSVLFAVIKDFRDKNLSVAKADRKQNILSVKINSKDQHFAKFFNQILVANVNEFYLQTKTKKSGDNLRILQQQADSVRRVLDGSLAEMARITDKTPNPNPMYLSSQVPVQKIKIDIQANAAIYEEIVKNLEITKLSHLNSRPLIQVVDAPEYPLPSDKLRPVKLIIQSILYGLLLSVVVFTIRYLYVSAIDENFQ